MPSGWKSIGFITEYKLPGYLLLHRAGGQAVSAQETDRTDLQACPLYFHNQDTVISIVQNSEGGSAGHPQGYRKGT